MRIFWLLVCWALAGAASAQEFARLYTDSATLKLAQPLEWVAVPKDSIASPDAFVNAAQSPSRVWTFRPYLRSDALPTSTTQEVWVRFSLPATAQPQTWFVRVPRLTISRVDFFYKSESQVWVKQSAGDTIARADWNLRTRSPSFEVQTRTDTAQTYYMRFVNGFAVTETPLLIAPIEYVDGASRVGIVLGLLWGLFSFVAIVSVAAYALLRNTVFLWFAGFVVSMLLTQLVLMGYGSWRLWPHSAYLSQVMNWVSPALSLAIGTWFIAKASYARDSHPWIYRLLALTAGSGLVLMCIALARLDFVTGIVRNAWVAAITLVALGSLAWTAFRSQAGNGLLLLGMGPIGFAVLARLAYNFGWVSHVEFAQASGVFLFSIGLLWILMVLMWRSRAGLVAVERSAALETFDAATGLVHSRIGQLRLPLMIKRGARFELGCGVVMLQWVDFENTVMKLSSEPRGAALARLGLILRRVSRDIDTVVRHSDKEFLILVEGPVSRESLTALCSKILSECMRSSDKAGEGNLFNLHVAVWQSASASGNTGEVMEMLQTRLNQMAHGTQRRVQFVDAIESAPHPDNEQAIAARRDDVLSKINAIEAAPIIPTIALAPRAVAKPVSGNSGVSQPPVSHPPASQAPGAQSASSQPLKTKPPTGKGW